MPDLPASFPCHRAGELNGVADAVRRDHSGHGSAQGIGDAAAKREAYACIAPVAAGIGT